MPIPAERAPVRVVGRYALHEEIASGGMASVHFGKLRGPAGFSPLVAIKALRPQYAKDPEFVKMLTDEARLAARVRHPNVVAVLDVHAGEGELFLVLEYVRGESLQRLLRAARSEHKPVPTSLAVAVVCDVLAGLHAAHEAKDERGEALGIVHRDVSPENVLVGADGVARVFDFGVAKAKNRMQTTREGQVKGKLAYMAPEQLRGEPVNRQADVFAASVVLWEMLTGERLFPADDDARTVDKVLFATVTAPGTLRRDVPKALDGAIMRGLARERARRFGTAREMALALQAAVTPAASSEVGEWVEGLAFDALDKRAQKALAIEASSGAAPTAPTAASPPKRSRGLMFVAASVALATAGAFVALRHFRGIEGGETKVAVPPVASAGEGPAVLIPAVIVPTPASPARTGNPPASTRTGAHRHWSPKRGASPAPAVSGVSPTTRCAGRNADGVIEFDTECLRAAQKAP